MLEDLLGWLVRTVDVLARLPARFDMEQVTKKYPFKYDDCMNTVLVQDCYRFNSLYDVVKSTLVNIRKAIKGEVVMSSELEKMGNSMFNGQVPALWAARAYPSLKPLGSWVSDYIARLNALHEWIAHGAPNVYWMSGLFFPQAFLTGILQNFARKEKIAIDRVGFVFKVLKTDTTAGTCAGGNRGGGAAGVSRPRCGVLSQSALGGL